MSGVIANKGARKRSSKNEESWHSQRMRQDMPQWRASTGNLEWTFPVSHGAMVCAGIGVRNRDRHSGPVTIWRAVVIERMNENNEARCLCHSFWADWVPPCLVYGPACISSRFQCTEVKFGQGVAYTTFFVLTKAFFICAILTLLSWVVLC